MENEIKFEYVGKIFKNTEVVEATDRTLVASAMS
jgi:hypothetical protein